MDPNELPQHLRQIAFEEFQETTALRVTKLEELKRRIAELPEESDKLVDTSNKNLLRFLRSRKYDMDKCLDSCVQWQKFYNKHHEILKNISKDSLDVFSKFIQVKREPGDKGRVVLIMRPATGLKLFTSELKKLYPRIMLQYNYWMFENLSFDPQVQVNGLIVINSFKNMTFADQMSMSSMAPMTDHIETFLHFQILGMRFKGAFIMEQPVFMTWLWFFLRPFMTEKVKSRFHLCGNNYDAIKEAFSDCSFLPDDVGGNASYQFGSNEVDEWFLQQINNM
eukprot:gene9065-12227_t